MKKKGVRKLTFPFERNNVKLNFDNPVIARSKETSHTFKMEMLKLCDESPMQVDLEDVVWLLAEGAEKDGSKFPYLFGLPQKKSR